ncbi:hypothetical protein IGI04_014722 [Brassica rapa subsp. trilocularis]|uniref:Secreted protein n=1 Tax=Brassica rapa subsp. trilocularis TaxID=1813537 RepID=A0ABQ7MNN7_BRACM|nr:hypothetical protein IGI04_014722 [Brassica rapa subsp. trilocularis]
MWIRVVGCSVVYGRFSLVFGGLSLFPSLLVSPSWHSGSALRRPGWVLLPGLGRRFSELRLGQLRLSRRGDLVG